MDQERANSILRDQSAENDRMIEQFSEEIKRMGLQID